MQFLFDDVLSSAGRRAGEAVRNVFGNALGSSLMASMRDSGARQSSVAATFDDDREARVSANPLLGAMDKRNRAEEAARILGEQAVSESDYAASGSPQLPVVSLSNTWDPSLPTVFIYGRRPGRAAHQAAELGRGLWEGSRAYPNGFAEGIKTNADGYRGIGYLVSGNIDNFRPRSTITLSDIARGIYENSPVGMLRAMADNNYRAAGTRLVGTVAGVGSGIGLPPLKNLPGLGYDVRVGAPREPSVMGTIAPDVSMNPFAPDLSRGSSIRMSPRYGVTFFGDEIVPFYGPSKATVGNPNGAPTFFMPLEGAALVKNARDAAVYTGMAPSATNAYLNGGDIYGYSFPTDSLTVSKPTAFDANGWPHFLEGGKTGVKLEGPIAGYISNSCAGVRNARERARSEWQRIV